MKNRVIAGTAALLVVVALVVVAVVAGGGDGTKEPKRLPIGASAPGVARDSAMAVPAGGGVAYGGVEYRLGDVPELPAEADAWELAPAVADVDRIAGALGVDRKDVRAENVGGAAWSVYLDQAVSSGVAYACPAETKDVTTTTCEPPPDYKEPQRPGGMPTKDEARDIAETMMGKLGVDLGGATVRVDDGFSQWTVSVDTKLDGRDVVGMTTTIGIGPYGKVVSANGWMGDVRRGDTYPLIAVGEAVRRLQENQPRIMAGAGERSLIAPAPDCVDCPPPKPTVVTITGARLGLQLYGGFEPNGPAYLVPTYLFTTDQPDSGELWQIAIDDKYLAPPPTVAPEPSTELEPGKTEPSGSGSSGGGGAPAPEPAPAPDQPTESSTTQRS